MARAAPLREKARTGHWVLCLEAFISLVQVGILGEVSGGSRQHMHQFSRCAFSGSWSPLIGQSPGRGL